MRPLGGGVNGGEGGRDNRQVQFRHPGCLRCGVSRARGADNGALRRWGQEEPRLWVRGRVALGRKGHVWGEVEGQVRVRGASTG